MGSLSTTGRADCAAAGVSRLLLVDDAALAACFAATIVQGGDEYHIGTGLFSGTGACGIRGKRYDARVIGGRL